MSAAEFAERDVPREIGADRRLGDVVITGATMPLIPSSPGDALVVRFHDLGEVSV